MKIEDFNDILVPQDLMNLLPNHGRSKVYNLLKTGEIKSIKSGNTYLIMKDDLLEYLEGGRKSRS